MDSLNKILVCLDPDTDQQPALDKAIYLAKLYGASIELLLVVYNRSLLLNHFFNSAELESAKTGFINSQKRWAETYLESTQKQQISCNVNVVWHKPLYEAIVQNAHDCQADLVIKSTHNHPKLNKLFFSPNDWQLLKYCPVPLILAKQNNCKTYQNILTAIDLSDTEKQSLNSLIINSGINISKKINANCHVTHCYEPLTVQMWSDIGFGMGVGMGPADFSMGEENYNEYLTEIKNQQNKSFKKSIKSYQFDDKLTHLEEGYAEVMLPILVEKLAIDLLVVGTSQHTGFVGSTVEKILDEVECDILSVRLVN